MKSFVFGLGMGLAAVAISFALRATFGERLFTHPLVVFLVLQAAFWLWYTSRFNRREQ